ncbi:MAG: tetratricopeptide repeat protein [Pseudomonadota bacterium]
MPECNTKRRADRLLRAKDYAKAALLYKQLARQGDPSANSALGYLHEFGKGVPLDLSKAERLYREALESDFATAGLYLSALLRRAGREKEAFELVEGLAHKGNLSLISELGSYWDRGIGCEKNSDIAKHYYEQAAENGSLFAKRWFQAKRIEAHASYMDIFSGFLLVLYYSLVMRLWGDRT